MGEPPALVAQRVHNIEAVIDRVVVREGVRGRIAESINLAVRHGDGLVLSAHEEKTTDGSAWHDRLFSTQYACPNCKISYEELEPRTFSFNSPYGACPACEGLGARVAFDPDLVLPDASLSLSAGAIAPWKGETPAAVRKHQNHLRPFLDKAGIRWDTPLEKLSPKLRRQLLHDMGPRFLGVLGMLEKEYATTANEAKRQRFETFRGEVACLECGGARLRPEARNVFIAGRAIHEITALSVAAARTLFPRSAWEHTGPDAPRASCPDTSQSLELPAGTKSVPAGRSHAERGNEDKATDKNVCPPVFLESQRPIAEPILSEIAARLDFLARVGLDYLTLDRPAGTLSGGELQRVRLAAGLGSGLVGVCYVLDEPSIGLHPRDNLRLIDALGRLQSRGNTVVVVEHDETIMRRADWLVDLGPGAGRHGGRLVAQGTPERIAAAGQSLTGRYLAGLEKIAVPEQRRRVAKTRAITLEGVTTNNLKDLSVQFPLSALVCVTGVSGSGKSSLVDETLARAWCAGWAASRSNPARTPASAAQARSTRWCRSTSRPSGARRGAIRRRTPVCSTRFARSLPAPATPADAATRPAASVST